jgi:hypothetical protein
MTGEELQRTIADIYAVVPQVRAVSVYTQPEQRIARVTVQAGMSDEYQDEVMEKLLDAEYAAHKEVERRMGERWTLDVSYI